MQKIITDAINALEKGAVILYPSDTVWGLACDATNDKAVRRLFELKKRDLAKSILIQIKDIATIKKYASIPFDTSILASFNEPTTIIYPYKSGLSPLLLAKDNTIAVRIPNDEFTQQLLAKFKKPIASTSANISGEPLPNYYKEISHEILEKVAYIVPMKQEDYMGIPSQIIRINGAEIIQIR